MIDNPKIEGYSGYDERSAGGIVYRIEGGRVKWLVIKTMKWYGRLGEKNSRKSVYKFPKGHLAKDESLKAAALREVEEEGRIKSQIIDKVGSRDYTIWDKIKKKKIIKKVTFFAMEYLGESSLKYYDRELVLGREWLTYEEAKEKLDYDSEKMLLGKAQEKLQTLLKSKKALE